MASKPREYNIPAHPNRDFWSSLWPTSSSPPAKATTVEPTPTYSVPKGSRRAKTPVISEEPSKSKKSKPTRTKSKSKSKKSSTSKGPGSWSEWYLSEDNEYFWRARKLPNDQWDYEKQPKPEPPQPEIQPLPHPHLEPITQQTQSKTSPEPEIKPLPHPHLETISQQTQPTTTITPQPEPQPLPHPHMQPISQPSSPKITIEDATPLSTSSSSSPSPSRTPSPQSNTHLKPPPSPALKSHRSGRSALTNPKSSYPTIITKSTGRPTEAITTSNPSPRTSGLALTRIESISPIRKPSPLSKPPKTASQQQPAPKPPKVVNPPAKKSSSPKRPIGPVMWLFTEGRSRKGKSLASPPPPAGRGKEGGDGGVVITKNKGTGVSNSELAKKKKMLDRKIREGKVVDTKVDSKKRIRAWLGGVEGEEELIPLDGEGFPVYR
ncbi:hypothetical protein QC762_208860 [Podospora pseudocomata]|uniref:WW domain-containing protein n=1 Tax=Podospora pseudocomata TaxID=2093779 RepID=A0ABR0GMK1_9PEZI|nr:hypothetical protein QC762_208860 [Podospora pseudocomata]